MEKEAWVVGVEGENIRLRYLRHSACANCGACLTMGRKDQELVLPNKMNLQVGDKVVVGLSSSSFLRATLIVYMVPLLFFLLGYVVGDFCLMSLGLSKWREAGGMISGLLFLFLTYKGINLYDRRLKEVERYQLKILRITKHADRSGENGEGETGYIE
jgi:sigma-E factor negative regulatory protein RseC